MITEIHINPPIATYQSPASLTDLRPINFIYGANGTGKTTISRIIDQSNGHKRCILNWKNNTQLETMVYNRDFVDNNFNQENAVKGVFTLGDNQIEAEHEITRLQPEIDKITEQINSLNNQLNGDDGISGKRREIADLEPQLITECWKKKQLYDNYFQTAFSGSRGSAKVFKEKVLTEKNSNSSNLLTLDELKEKANTIYAENLQLVATISNLSAGNLITAESHILLQKIIVGNQDIDIAVLINKIGNSDWVKKGLEYHQHSPDQCPFCQQKTNDKLTKSLHEFFNDTYNENINELSGLLNEYNKNCEILISSIKENSEIDNKFLNKEMFDIEAIAISERLKINQKMLEEKLREPSKKNSLREINPLVEKLQNLITEANALTDVHNNMVKNIKSEQKILTSQIWKYIVNELTNHLSQYEKEKNALNRSIEGMERSLEGKKTERLKLENLVKELEKQSTSIQPTKDAINNLLDTFGFNSFHIEIESNTNHYRICRKNGDDASHSLSEGEKTFITFLYFYSLIKGAQSSSGISNHRIVVFDDPISSLDSDILYIVSSLIKGIIEEVKQQTSQIKQVFLLTHNIYFHKEICFHKNRSKNNVMSDESFWVVKKQLQGSIIQRCNENPIRSAYELLWEDIKTKNISSLNIQNTLRRILENYFTMWGGKSKDEICNLFNGRDKLICQSLFSWVNDGSHSIHDDLYINHGTQTNESYLRIFKDIFDKAGQLGHYNMMLAME